jgi:hypothetical protein
MKVVIIRHQGNHRVSFYDWRQEVTTIRRIVPDSHGLSADAAWRSRDSGPLIRAGSPASMQPFHHAASLSGRVIAGRPEKRTSGRPDARRVIVFWLRSASA